MNDITNIWWLIIPESDLVDDRYLTLLSREEAEACVVRRTKETGIQHYLWKMERTPHI